MEMHKIHYALVYRSGWEDGNYQAPATSNSPSDCAHMILIRWGSNEIVGVRIHAIDDVRHDYLYLPDSMYDVICQQIKRPAAIKYSHTRCFRLKYGVGYTRAVMAGTVRTSPNYSYRPLSSISLAQPAACALCKQPITPMTRRQED